MLQNIIWSQKTAHPALIQFLGLFQLFIGTLKNTSLRTPWCQFGQFIWTIFNAFQKKNVTSEVFFFSSQLVHLMNDGPNDLFFYSTFHIFYQMKKNLKDKDNRDRLWYKKVNQNEKAHTCSENPKLTRKKCTKHEQSKRKSSYMQQES